MQVSRSRGSGCGFRRCGCAEVRTCGKHVRQQGGLRVSERASSRRSAILLTSFPLPTSQRLPALDRHRYAFERACSSCIASFISSQPRRRKGALNSHEAAFQEHLPKSTAPAKAHRIQLPVMAQTKLVPEHGPDAIRAKREHIEAKLEADLDHDDADKKPRKQRKVTVGPSSTPHLPACDDPRRADSGLRPHRTAASPSQGLV